MATTVKRLRQLGKRMTQSEAARYLEVSRAYVGQLAITHDIQFVVRDVVVPPTYCSRCKRQRHAGYDRCLRCHWTPTRIRALRRRYVLGQEPWSRLVLKMAPWTAGRWESAANKPNRKSLVLLETLDRFETAVKTRDAGT